MSKRLADWLKRTAGEVGVLALALAITAALASVLVPIDFPDGVLAGEEMRRFYNRQALRLWIMPPLWIGVYYVLHRLYCRWRARSSPGVLGLTLAAALALAPPLAASRAASGAPTTVLTPPLRARRRAIGYAGAAASRIKRRSP